MEGAKDIKAVVWMGDSLANLREFPLVVRSEVGFALYQAQRGGKHVSVKPLKGFGGASVLEVVEDDDGNTYRAVYTVKFKEVLYVLHAFQKKSKHGSKTPQSDLDLINARLKQAQAHYEQRKHGHEKKK